MCGSQNAFSVCGVEVWGWRWGVLLGGKDGRGPPWNPVCFYRLKLGLGLGGGRLCAKWVGVA